MTAPTANLTRDESREEAASQFERLLEVLTEAAGLASRMNLSSAQGGTT